MGQVASHCGLGMAQTIRRPPSPHFFCCSMGPILFPPVVDPYLSLMVTFSSRWKSLVIEGHSASFSRFFTLGAADLQSLELLALDFDPSGYGNRSPHQLTTAQWSKCGLLTTPSLRKLSIRRVHSMRPTNLTVNWSQLTHLELYAPGSTRDAMTMGMFTASKILQVTTRFVFLRNQNHWMGRPFSYLFADATAPPLTLIDMLRRLHPPLHRQPRGPRTTRA